MRNASSWVFLSLGLVVLLSFSHYNGIQFASNDDVTSFAGVQNKGLLKHAWDLAQWQVRFNYLLVAPIGLSPFLVAHPIFYHTLHFVGFGLVVFLCFITAQAFFQSRAVAKIDEFRSSASGNVSVIADRVSIFGPPLRRIWVQVESTSTEPTTVAAGTHSRTIIGGAARIPAQATRHEDGSARVELKVPGLILGSFMISTFEPVDPRMDPREVSVESVESHVARH